MGMCVDKSRSDTFSAGINRHCVRRDFGDELCIGSCGSDAAVLDQQRSVTDEPQFAKLGADAGTRWSSEGNELSDVDNCDRARHVYFSAIGMWIPFSRAVWRAR